MLAGIEWLVEALDCSADCLQSLQRLQIVCGQLIDDLELRVVESPQWHKFPGPGGVTGLYLLTESHLACHTYPEAGLATFNLYCCRERPLWNWHENLVRHLVAQHVVVRSMPRGSAVDSVSRSSPGMQPSAKIANPRELAPGVAR